MSNRNISSDEVLDSYNPFAPRESIRPNVAPSAPRPDFSPAVLPDSPNPIIKPNEGVFREIQERERALNDMERKIQQREEELNKKEDAVKDLKINNFPPLPQCFPCKPCFYQDIDVDIAIEYRGIVKLGFYVWIAYSILLFINVFGSLSYLIVSPNPSDTGPLFGVSLLMFFLMPPLGYALWFRPLYRAFRSQSSINFFLFFLCFAVLIIVLIIQTLGINVLGSCGWINSLVALKVNTGVSVVMILIACGFTAMGAVSVFLYIKVHRTYRTTGASFSKAKAEMRNETVSAALHA